MSDQDAQPVSIEYVRICRTCFGLYETQHPSGHLQRCACRADEATWPGYDFNEHVHLCECCRTRALTSGSKWSSFLCTDCKALAVAVNERAGHLLVPFGRHSFMGGIALRGSDVIDAALERGASLLEGFAAGMSRLSASIEAIFAFGKETLKQDLGVLDLPQDQDVDLAAFLDAAHESERKEEELGYGGDWWGSEERFGNLCWQLREAARKIHGPAGSSLWRPYLEHRPVELGLERCGVCGEFRGPRAKCLCQGVSCIACKKRMAHRPISNFYVEETGGFVHVPHFTPPLCSRCFDRSSKRRAP